MVAGPREKIWNGQMGDKRFGDEGGAREQKKMTRSVPLHSQDKEIA